MSPRVNLDSDIIHVSHSSLQPNTLRRVIEEFVSRDGTDYGNVEKTVEQTIADVMRQLDRGEARLVVDPATGSVN